MKENINVACGRAKEATVKPLLRRLLENAKKNNEDRAKRGYRHDMVIKDFAAALFCLIGRSGYELLQANLGGAIPTVCTVERMISKKKLSEGKFYFDGLKEHLLDWMAPPFVHIHLDDTRVKNRVEYDQPTNRYVGWCLPIKNGIPDINAFVLETYEEIKHAFECETVAKYAHCIVVKSVSIVVPSFVLFVLGTDSKYDSSVIISRFSFISSELKKRGITVVSSGADGAGPFLKAMMIESGLFKKTLLSNLPKNWSFFNIPNFKEDNLYFQDHVHLLAKLRSRLLNPSNLLIIGNDAASRVHLLHVLHMFPKSRHNLSLKCIDSKDKQNYASITTILSNDVECCLDEISNVLKTRSTIAYIKVMRSYRDAVFDKAISPLERIHLIWFSVFFCRLWRTWLGENGYNEENHFITPNIYSCLELNAHMLVCVVRSCMLKKLPPDALRIWLSGSQGCEEKFRLLRSMTGTFSTIINFTMRGIMGRINKLNFISSAECSDDIVFPRVKRRLLQLKTETNETFRLPSDIIEIYACIIAAKNEAIDLAKSCNLNLTSYEDGCLAESVESADIVEMTVILEEDIDEHIVLGAESATGEDLTEDEVALYREEAFAVQQDLLCMQKTSTSGLPVYDVSINDGGKKYNARHFIRYNDAFIRKSTALYLLQENIQLSNDRLLRVREDQPTHLYSGSLTDEQENCSHVIAGDLCIFRRIDCHDKVLLGRLVSFAYPKGNTKKDRAYSSSYVDMGKPTYRNIAVFANWYAMDDSNDTENITFKSVDTSFYAGYISMENYICTLSGDVNDIQESSFSISTRAIESSLPNWADMLSVVSEFSTW